MTTPAEHEALDWVIRMAEPDADWDAFTAWLEADASRAGTYDRMATALHDAEAAVAATPVAPRWPDAAPTVAIGRPRPAIRHTRWLGGAIAATLVGAVGLGVWTDRAAPYSVATAAGEQRSVTLADGSSIVLAGATRVQLDRSDDRVATVEQGEALFRVRHDASRPFTAQAGGLQLTDLGTVFDVRLGGGPGGQRTRVAVAEGAVHVASGDAALRLDPGQAAVSDGRTLVRQATDAAEVGSWREGRLAFDDATLADVAEDLSRQLGRRVVAAAPVARRTFRGTLDTQRLKDDPALLGTLLGVTVRQEAGGWTLEPRR